MKIKRLVKPEAKTVDIRQLDTGSLFTIEDENIAGSDIFESTVFMKTDEFPSVVRLIDGEVLEFPDFVHNDLVIDVTNKFTLVESE